MTAVAGKLANNLEEAKPLMNFGWLMNKQVDLFFIFGFLTIGFLSTAIVSSNPKLFYPILFLDLWLLGYHHVISTYTRLVFDSESRKKYFQLLTILPLIVVAAVAGAYKYIEIYRIRISLFCSTSPSFTRRWCHCLSWTYLANTK